MKYLYLTITSLILGSSLLFPNKSLQAQQVPLISEYFHSPEIVNPAMVGWEDLTAVTLSYRHQWTDMRNNPITFRLNFRHFDEKRNMAFGGGLTHDQTGPTSFTGIGFQYAYHLKFGSEKSGADKRHRLAIGIALSANQYRLDGNKLQYNDVDDPLIVGNSVATWLPDASIGAFYYTDMYFVGISVPQLIAMNVRFESDNALSNIQRVAHAYFNAGVKIKLKGAKESTSRRSLMETVQHMLIPSLWFRYAPSSPLSIHMNLRYVWKQVLGIGVGATTDGTLAFDLSVQLKKRFRVGYAFGVPLNPLAPQLGTNHEIMLSYVFGSNGKGWLFEAAEQQIRFKKKKESKKGKL